MHVHSQTGGEIRHRVESARQDFCDAVAAGDARAAAAAYAEDAVLLAPQSEALRGRADIESFWEAGIAAGVVSIRLESSFLTVDQHLAYEIGRYCLRMTPTAEGTVTDRGTYVHVYVPQADRHWLRVAESLHPDRTAPHQPLPRSCNAAATASGMAREGRGPDVPGGVALPHQTWEGRR